MTTHIEHPEGSVRTRIGLADLERLPPTLKPEEAFALLGLGRTTGYELIRKNELPALRLGGKLLIPTASLLRLIGWERAHRETGEPAETAGSDEA